MPRAPQWSFPGQGGRGKKHGAAHGSAAQLRRRQDRAQHNDACSRLLASLCAPAPPGGVGCRTRAQESAKGRARRAERHRAGSAHRPREAQSLTSAMRRTPRPARHRPPPRGRPQPRGKFSTSSGPRHNSSKRAVCAPAAPADERTPRPGGARLRRRESADGAGAALFGRPGQGARPAARLPRSCCRGLRPEHAAARCLSMQAQFREQSLLLRGPPGQVCRCGARRCSPSQHPMGPMAMPRGMCGSRSA